MVGNDFVWNIWYSKNKKISFVCINFDFILIKKSNFSKLQRVWCVNFFNDCKILISRFLIFFNALHDRAWLFLVFAKIVHIKFRLITQYNTKKITGFRQRILVKVTKKKIYVSRRFDRSRLKVILETVKVFQLWQHIGT